MYVNFRIHTIILAEPLKSHWNYFNCSCMIVYNTFFLSIVYSSKPLFVFFLMRIATSATVTNLWWWNHLSWDNKKAYLQLVKTDRSIDKAPRILWEGITVASYPLLAIISLYPAIWSHITINQHSCRRFQTRRTQFIVLLLQYEIDY